jgi:hypothetical protein
MFQQILFSFDHASQSDVETFKNKGFLGFAS